MCDRLASTPTYEHLLMVYCLIRLEEQWGVIRCHSWPIALCSFPLPCRALFPRFPCAACSLLGLTSLDVLAADPPALAKADVDYSARESDRCMSATKEYVYIARNEA